MKKIIARILAANLLIVLLLHTCSCQREQSGLIVSFFNAGRADVVALKTAQSTVLIDTGEEQDSKAVARFLTDAGVKRIDVLIITHFDTDCIGGAETILRNFEIGTVYEPDFSGNSEEARVYASALSEKDLLPIVLTEDITFSLDGAIYSLYCAQGENYDQESSNRSIVTKAVYGRKRFLFCADAEQQRVSELLCAGTDFSCDVLKAPRHGAYFEALPTFLAECTPDISIISCSQEKPEDERTVQALKKIGSDVYLTREGDVHLFCDGETIEAIQ